MSKTLEELAPAEKNEQLTEAAKKLTVEDLQSIQEVFSSGSDAPQNIEAAYCCCCGVGVPPSG